MIPSILSKLKSLLLYGYFLAKNFCDIKIFPHLFCLFMKENNLLADHAKTKPPANEAILKGI